MYKNNFQSWAIFQCRPFIVHPYNHMYVKYLDKFIDLNMKGKLLNWKNYFST